MMLNNNSKKSKSWILASNQILVPNKPSVQVNLMGRGQTAHAYNTFKGERGLGNIDHVTEREDTKVSLVAFKGIPGFHSLARDQLVLTLKGNWTPVRGLTSGSKVAGLNEGWPVYFEVLGTRRGRDATSCTVRMSDLHTFFVGVGSNCGILTPDVTTLMGTKFTPLPPAPRGSACQFKARQVASVHA